ncbi:MAG: M48 family metallopeptidase [Rubrivivax sp.]
MNSPTSPGGQLFDGRSAQGQLVRLSLEGAELCLHRLSDGAEPALKRYPRSAVTWPEKTRHGVRQVLLPDGGVVSLADAAVWDAWSAQQGLEQVLAVRWALSWPTALVSMGVLVVVLLVSGIWGLPWAAEKAAPWVPQSVREQIDSSAMAQLRRQGWLLPSQMPEGTAQQVEAELRRMLSAAYPAGEAPRVTLAVYRMPDWAGPNAFALPGGQVVVSDALLRLLPAEDGRLHPGVLGVLAHEVGHVHRQHGLRNVLASSVTGVLLGWWVGDYSSTLAAAPALIIQAGYSRSAEREADDEALRILRAAGVDPRGMVAFFAALKKAYPERDGDSPSFGLATHPPDSERVKLFETGRR